MVVGVFCEQREMHVTFELCASCAQCLPAPIIKSLRIYDYVPQRGVYYLKEVIGCLRKAYMTRKASQVETHLSLRSLYAIKRGKIFGNMVDGSRWKELDGSLSFKVDGENAKLTARLDSYDPEKAMITELKSLEGIERKNLPRDKDVLQVKGYGTIFKSIIPVRQLSIVYLDMNSFKQFSVPLVDLTDWLQKRLFALHRAIRDSRPPDQEPSFECRFCEHRGNCNLTSAPFAKAATLKDRGLAEKAEFPRCHK